MADKLTIFGDKPKTVVTQNSAYLFGNNQNNNPPPSNSNQKKQKVNPPSNSNESSAQNKQKQQLKQASNLLEIQKQPEQKQNESSYSKPAQKQQKKIQQQVKIQNQAQPEKSVRESCNQKIEKSQQQSVHQKKERTQQQKAPVPTVISVNKEEREEVKNSIIQKSQEKKQESQPEQAALQRQSEKKVVHRSDVNQERMDQKPHKRKPIIYIDSKCLSEVEIIKKEIQENAEQIKESRDQIVKLKKQQVKLNQQERENRQDIKKKKKRICYLQENKSENKEAQDEIKQFKEQIQRVNKRKMQISVKLQIIKSQIEQIEDHKLGLQEQNDLLEEKLKFNTQFKQLKQGAYKLDKLIRDNIQGYKEKEYNFIKQYQKVNQKQREKLFQQLKNLTAKGKKLQMDRKIMNQQILKTQFAHSIQINSDKFEYRAYYFFQADQLYEFCKNKYQKKGSPKETEEAVKKLMLIQLLKGDSNYKQLVNNLSKEMGIESQESIRQKKQQEQMEIRKKKEEEEQIKRRQKYALQQQQRKEKEEKQKAEKEQKCQLLHSKITEVCNKINDSIQTIKSIDILKANTFESLQETVKLIQSILKNLGQSQNYYQSIKQDYFPLYYQLQKDEKNLQNYQKILEQSHLVQKRTKKQLNKSEFRALQLYNKERLQEREREQSELIILESEKKEHLPFKNMYGREIQQLKSKDSKVGQKVLHYLSIKQKYLNQLRILIELNNVSEEELKANHFDKQKYQQLVGKKIKIFNKFGIIQELSQQIIGKEQIQKNLVQLQEIQEELAPLQVVFNVSYIQSLQKIPKEMMITTKQQIFEISLKKEIAQLQQELKKEQQQMQKTDNLINSKRASIQTLKKKNEQMTGKRTEVEKKRQRQIKKELFPNVDKKEENSVIEDYEPDYKVIIKSQQKLIEKYKQLKDDTKLTQVKIMLDNLMKERANEEKQLLEIKRQCQNYHLTRRRNLNREVYLGDPEKLRNNRKIQQLERQLQGLMEQWRNIQRNMRPSSRIDRGSQIRFISRIQ